MLSSIRYTEAKIQTSRMLHFDDTALLQCIDLKICLEL